MELIAHRAGNEARLVAGAAAVADTIEIDVHLFRRRLEVRHAKALWPTAWLWERWRWANDEPRPPLEEILAAAPDGLGLWFDLKGFTRRLTRRVIATAPDAPAAADQPVPHAPTKTMSCRQWWLLPPARTAGYRTCRSVGSRWQVWLATRRPDRPSPDGHVINQSLATPDVVAALLRRHPMVVAWGITTAARARELAELGVTGVIADSLDLLADLRTL